MKAVCQIRCSYAILPFAARGEAEILPEQPPVITPTAMEGRGAYNRSSRVQAAGLSPAVPMLQRAARTATLPAEPQPIVIADYGSSQGRNSLAPMAAAIDVLRERLGPDRSISVVHTDVPENDFSALFQTLNTDPNSYLRTHQAVFASAVGRSFYQQILPPSSITLGWSSWAVQWLSRSPGEIPDQIQVALSRDATARRAFSQQSAEDWRDFLTARGRELCPGGRLAILNMALDQNGDFGYRPVLDALYATLLDLVESGFLRAGELRRMAMLTVARSREDVLAPFGAEGRFASLRVEEMEFFYGEDHIWDDYELHGNAKEFGAQWAAFSRASVYPTLAEGLHGGRQSARATEFIDRLEAGTAARLAAKPEHMLIPLCKLLLAKDA